MEDIVALSHAIRSFEEERERGYCPQEGCIRIIREDIFSRRGMGEGEVQNLPSPFPVEIDYSEYLGLNRLDLFRREERQSCYVSRPPALTPLSVRCFQDFPSFFSPASSVISTRIRIGLDVQAITIRVETLIHL